MAACQNTYLSTLKIRVKKKTHINLKIENDYTYICPDIPVPATIANPSDQKRIPLI